MITNFTNTETTFDETYEFGECERCAESDNDSIVIENEIQEESSEYFEKGRKSFFFILSID